MIVPEPWVSTPMIQWPLNKNVCRSLVLLFGFIPIDIHQFRFQKITESEFSERSITLTNKEWHHDRTLQQSAQGTKIIDVVSFESRLPFVGSLLQPIYKHIFLHRHKRLKQMYGSGYHRWSIVCIPTWSLCIRNYLSKCISALFVESKLSHQPPQSVTWLLNTKNAHDLYEKYVFTNFQEPTKFMYKPAESDS